MTDQKLYEILSYYEWNIPLAVEALENNHIHEYTPALDHLLDMIPQMREFIRDARREKLMRWLGWMQGVLFMAGVYTLEELKEHNKP